MQEVRDAHLAPTRPLQLVAGALCAIARGQVLPGVNVLAPVVEEPSLAQRFGRAELLFKVVSEADEDIAIGGVVAGCFVVELPADDGGVVLVVGHDVADETLGIKTIGRRVGVHILAHAVGALHAGTAEHATGQAIGQDLRMLVGHPGGNGVGRCSKNHLDAGLSHRVDDAIHPRVIKLTVGRLPEAPGGFAHANDVDAGGFHQGYILVEAGGLISGHVFVVVGGAIENGGEVERPGQVRIGIRAGLLRTSSGCGQK